MFGQKDCKAKEQFTTGRCVDMFEGSLVKFVGKRDKVACMTHGKSLLA
jgi:hypothetical protein